MASIGIGIASSSPWPSLLSFSSHSNPNKTLTLPIKTPHTTNHSLLLRPPPRRHAAFLPTSVSTHHNSPPTNYQFSDGGAEVELRLDIGTLGVLTSNDVFLDVDDNSLLIRVKSNATLITLFHARQLFDKIMPSQTIWYIDDDQLVVNLKKHHIDLKWPDVMESWESLTTGIAQLLNGTSIYIVGDSTEINQHVANILAMGIGYTPLCTKELLESYAQQSIDSWVALEGAETVAEAEAIVFENLSSHVRTVIATLGGTYGAARKHDKWQHLYAGFTVWVSVSEATDENSAKEEVRRHIEEGNIAYTQSDVVVKLGGWDLDNSQVVAQACLSALKQLTLSDRQLTGKKSLYIRLGCRGDWPNIEPPGWDPSVGVAPES